MALADAFDGSAISPKVGRKGKCTQFGQSKLIPPKASSKLSSVVYLRLTFGICLLLGCSDPEPASGHDAHAIGRSQARLRVDVTVHRDGEPQLGTEALLYRYHDLDELSAHRIAGATRPTIDNLAIGQCRTATSERILDEALSSTSPESTVEMLDAGDIALRAGGLLGRMVPRYLPMILSFVSGVVYVVADEPGIRLPADVANRATVYVSAFGGEQIGHFDVQSQLPALPRLQTTDATGLLIVDRNQDLPLIWSTVGRAPEDTTLIILRWGDRTDGLYCRPRAAGRFVIPRSSLAAVPNTDTLQLRIERSRRLSFGAAGLDDGELVISTTDLLTVRAL